MQSINNIEHLRDDLLKAYSLLREDPDTLDQCRELSNLAGKIINSAKVQLVYADMRRETPDVGFLNVGHHQNQSQILDEGKPVSLPSSSTDKG